MERRMLFFLLFRLTFIRRDQLRVAVLVQRGQHDERTIRLHVLPSVIPYYIMDGEKQVVIRFLEGLGDDVEFTFVATALVSLFKMDSIVVMSFIFISLL